MADYLKRPGELIEAIEQIKSQQTADEHQRLRQGLMNYLDSRKAALDDLDKLLDDMKPGNTEDPWQARVDQARTDLNRHLGDSLNGVTDPSVPALGFRAVALRDEHQFWTGLREVKVAQARDQIADNGQKVAQLADELDKKWQAISAADSSYDEKEKQVGGEAEIQVWFACEKIAEKRRAWKEQVLGPMPLT